MTIKLIDQQQIQLRLESMNLAARVPVPLADNAELVARATAIYNFLIDYTADAPVVQTLA